jgi:outer membrane protein
MKRRLLPILIAAAVLVPACAPASTATDLTDIGYVDQSAFALLPMFASARQQLATFQAQLSGQYTSAMRGAHSNADRQRVYNNFQARYANEQRVLFGPLFERVNLAIASVASTRRLSVIVDKRIIIYGGQDVTKDVVKLLQSSQTILPLGTAPPPSPIGYVDPTAFQNSPQAKAANNEMNAFVQQQQHIYGAQLAHATSDTQKQQIAAAYNKAVADEQTKVLKPVVDHEQAVAASVARSKGLLLIIDHADILYGATDITADVQNALDK